MSKSIVDMRDMDPEEEKKIELDLAVGTQILSLQSIEGRPVLFLAIDMSETRKASRSFEWRKTTYLVPKNGQYIGTFTKTEILLQNFRGAMVSGGTLVKTFHLFETTPLKDLVSRPRGL